MSFIQAIILAIVEGLTEFLPVSSTGHLMVAGALMGMDLSDDFVQLFNITIQLGTILSVVVLYFKRFFRSFAFYFKLIVALIPAAVLGVLFKDNIDQMLGDVRIVAISLFVGGIVLLFIDNVFKHPTEDNADHIKYPSAFVVGLIQCLAMIPGVSRSAASIIGGMGVKLTRKAAAEFSFFLAVPTMFGATIKELYDHLFKKQLELSGQEINLLLIGNVIGFLVAMVAIKSFISYLQNHGFKWFGVYRIIIGVVIFVLVEIGYLG